jgi:putative lipoic acid-binding regulatory protein
MTDKSSLIEFPCEFLIKIIGKKTKVFLDEITALVRKHYPDFDESNLTSQLSAQGNYQAISITVNAQDQQTLDALYRDLTQHPDVKMVL